MRITVLGCGGSCGVPLLACKCDTCTSSSEYNKRTRSSILISSDDKKNARILIDFAYEMRLQLLRADINDIDAAILTHDHSDQVSGIDDLRVFSFNKKAAIPCYATSAAFDTMLKRYGYLFKEHEGAGPFLEQNVIEYYTKRNIAGMEFEFFDQDHGFIHSTGIRVGDFIYTNDVIGYPQESLKHLKETKIWMIDAMDYHATRAHFGIDKVLELRQQFQPDTIYLTNMGHNLEYYKLQQEMPNNVIPCYDNMELKI